MRRVALGVAFALLVFWSAGSVVAAEGAEQETIPREEVVSGQDRGAPQAELEEAIASFQRVLEVDPRDPTAHLQLAYLYSQIGRWAEAVRHLEAALEQDPDNPRHRMQLGYALQNLGEVGRAAQQFELVAERPGELQAQARLALEAVRRLQAQQSEQAVASLSDPLVRRDEYLNYGYAHLSRKDFSAARGSFERALAEDPANPNILVQLGYLALEQTELTLAAQRFEAARAVQAEDYGIALQLGYIYDRLKETKKAEESFQDALPSPDLQVHQAAEQALSYLRAGRRRFYLEMFGNTVFFDRFDNFVGPAQVQLGWQPLPGGPVSLYLDARFTGDTRSHAGQLPAIFGDNVALFGAGVSLRPRGWNLSLNAEWHMARNLIRFAPDRTARTEPDYRASLNYYLLGDGRLGGPLWLLTLGQAHSDRLFSEVDVSLGYYSRYRDNGIGYLQLREGMHLANPGAARLSGYLKISVVKDTKRDFFNNLVEFGPGIEFRPHRAINLGVRAEYLRGVYFGIAGLDRNPYAPQYDDRRVMVFYGWRF